LFIESCFIYAIKLITLLFLKYFFRETSGHFVHVYKTIQMVYPNKIIDEMYVANKTDKKSEMICFQNVTNAKQ